MKTNIVIAIIVSNVIYAVNAVPQRNVRQSLTTEDPSVQIEIDKIFGNNRNVTRRPGIGDVVTPDPTYIPTTGPTVLTIKEQTCTCVPYHRCDPNTNTIKRDEADSANDDAVTGFGAIDIRFGERDCQDVLDVCCISDAQTPESITPKPVENVPTYEAGCGVRNVNGLDFQVAGALVSNL